LRPRGPMKSAQLVTGPVEIWKENEFVTGSINMVEVFHQSSELIPNPRVPIVPKFTL